MTKHAVVGLSLALRSEEVLASLHNTAPHLHRLHEATNIDQACRLTAFSLTDASGCSPTSE